ncbi:hypothetical protein G6F22_013329 [Rhizopus arrhizus]|nr:hypothetical protein G6F22_013329 [Rhizopus arrhizus]KAG1253338.1 hypothetical protein G6F68_011384 [Rhizopus microsporus]
MAIRTASDRDDAPEEAHEINVTPFIDVMLVLLIIFMVAAPLATVSVPVQLPASSAVATPPEQAPVYVTVQADLSLRVGEQPVARDALAAALKAATHDDSGQRIFLRADTRVPYGELMATLDALRAAGYLKVALPGDRAAGARTADRRGVLVGGARAGAGGCRSACSADAGTGADGPGTAGAPA